MDLDLARVRAFTATAGSLHFGRAAEELGISQQALSKRIARLEGELGVALFDRSGHPVALTEAGLRFLEPATRLLAAGELAVARARGARRPLRLDVWGHLYAPMRTVAPVLESAQGLIVEPGSGRDLPSVAAALLRGDTDLGFGRVHPLGDVPNGELPEGLSHRPARLEPVDAVLSADHPLAGADALRPDELRNSVLWCPAALERLDFLRHFAERFGIDEVEVGANLGLVHSLERIRAQPRGFTLFPADSSLPELPGLRVVPLVEPTPLYAWSLLWRADAHHPELEPLLEHFAAQADRRRWLHHDPDHDWLP